MATRPDLSGGNFPIDQIDPHEHEVAKLMVPDTHPSAVLPYLSMVIVRPRGSGGPWAVGFGSQAEVNRAVDYAAKQRVIDTTKNEPEPGMPTIEKPTVIESENDVLPWCRVEGQSLIPPGRDEIEVPPKIYASFKKLMTNNLGKWKTKGARFEFPGNISPEKLLDDLLAGRRPNYKTDWHFFPTPREVVDQMASIVLPRPRDGEEGLDLCDPSAGRADIIKVINEVFPWAKHRWTTVEPEPGNREILTGLGYPPDHDSFETWETDKRFDVIYANPPFRHDRDHVEKMVTLLKPQGDIVCVLPSMFPEKNADLVERLGDEFLDVSWRALPDKSFKSSQTSVSTGILHLANWEGGDE